MCAIRLSQTHELLKSEPFVLACYMFGECQTSLLPSLGKNYKANPDMLKYSPLKPSLSIKFLLLKCNEGEHK